MNLLARLSPGIYCSPSSSPSYSSSPSSSYSSYSTTSSSSSMSLPLIAPGKFYRSRTPPSAASSRYNMRGRLYSSPMTAISEREGELSDDYEDQWESSSRTLGQHLSPFSLSLASPSATLCKGGSS